MTDLTLWDYVLVFGTSFASAFLVVALAVVWMSNREQGK